MATRFVTNSPTRTCCGQPVGACRCVVGQDDLEPLPTLNALLAAERAAAGPGAGKPKGKKQRKPTPDPARRRPGVNGFRVPDYAGAAGGLVGNRALGPVDQDDLDPLPTYAGLPERERM